MRGLSLRWMSLAMSILAPTLTRAQEACVEARLTLAYDSPDLTAPSKSRICFPGPDPDLVLNLKCQPLSPETQIDNLPTLRTSLNDLQAIAHKPLTSNQPGINGDTSIATASIAGALDTGTCKVARDRHVVSPTEGGDRELSGACVKVYQGPNVEQATTLDVVMQITDLLPYVTLNRETINSCSFDVTKRTGGDAIAKGCFVPFQASIFNPDDKSIKFTCP